MFAFYLSKLMNSSTLRTVFIGALVALLVFLLFKTVTGGETFRELMGKETRSSLKHELGQKKILLDQLEETNRRLAERLKLEEKSSNLTEDLLIDKRNKEVELEKTMKETIKNLESRLRIAQAANVDKTPRPAMTEAEEETVDLLAHGLWDLYQNALKTEQGE